MKKKFSEFLQENGLAFAHVNDPEKITVFGHTERNLEKPEPPEKDEAEKKKKEEKRKGFKLFQYLAYAKNIND